MSSQAVTPRRLTALILPVCLAGLGVLIAAGSAFATTAHSGRELLGLAALIGAATLAERFPVPINAESGGGVVSLTFVFAVAAIVLYVLLITRQGRALARHEQEILEAVGGKTDD